MKNLALLALLCLPLLACPTTGGDDDDDDSAMSDDDDDDSQATTALVRFTTTAGVIDIELDLEGAPITSENFLAYVDSGFFDGSDGLGRTVFHRAIEGFVIQGGGFTPDLQRKDTLPPIVNEADVARPNVQGSLSMARTSDPDSATSQFFVNLVDNDFLDPGGATEAGYAVFGQVTSDWSVIEAIGSAPTGNRNGLEDVPLDLVEVTMVERL